mmetsp:Transcript_18194/g.37349  ORF Transcript_18194/g.37349 Transcript_18194/m.37349 type:complete len:335 (-) Transcript_18194:251-1255(-)
MSHRVGGGPVVVWEQGVGELLWGGHAPRKDAEHPAEQQRAQHGREDGERERGFDLALVLIVVVLEVVHFVPQLEHGRVGLLVVRQQRLLHDGLDLPRVHHGGVVLVGGDHGLLGPPPHADLPRRGGAGGVRVRALGRGVHKSVRARLGRGLAPALAAGHGARPRNHLAVRVGVPVVGALRAHVLVDTPPDGVLVHPNARVGGGRAGERVVPEVAAELELDAELEEVVVVQADGVRGVVRARGGGAHAFADGRPSQGRGGRGDGAAVGHVGRDGAGGLGDGPPRLGLRGRAQDAVGHVHRDPRGEEAGGAVGDLDVGQEIVPCEGSIVGVEGNVS